jgi:tetratricopeptide (TPR) repeat protein
VPHYWLRGGLRSDRANALVRLGLPPQLMATVDAHRNLRGPYTAGGTVVRALTPTVLQQQPELARRHDIELLSVAPELGNVLPNSRQTLTSMALPKERTRFYARLRTLRTAHGLVEFLRDGMPAAGSWTLVVENIEHAEFTDLEFLTAALRRLDPQRLTLVLCSGVIEARDELLTKALASYASIVEVEAMYDDTAADSGSATAWEFVLSECTSDVPALRAAYDALSAEQRAEMHDRRAAELAQVGEFSLTLGALPFHLEHGSNPADAGANALYKAQDHCLCLGFYEAVVDYATRAMALIDPVSNEKFWWGLAVQLGLAYSILGRTHEAMALYDEARLRSKRPEVHMAAAYSTAMLYTRHNDAAERDEKLAKSWLHSAIATASLLEDRVERAFQSAFYANGLALVEVNLGDMQEALGLVDNCISGLDEKLEPHEHRLHRAVLKNNRARVYLGLGRLAEALADYAVVIEEDPNHCEHYLERGNIYRRLGRYEEASADYAKAISLTPPFPEIYYNRADLRLLTGDEAGALADFSYVIEVDPTFVDAYVNRAGIYLEQGEYELALADATEGLTHDPDNAYLYTVLGQVYAERDEGERARGFFDRALELDPKSVAALSGRAMLAYESGDLTAALSDMTTAVELDPADAALRYNRGFLLVESGGWAEALVDLNVAAELTPDDEAIRDARQACLRNLAAV